MKNLGEGGSKLNKINNLASATATINTLRKTEQMSSTLLRKNPLYNIDAKRWTYLRAHVRQDWHTIHVALGGELEDLRAGWLELFFDLIFVATIVNISKVLTETDNHQYYPVAFAQFVLIYSTWLDALDFETRFSARQFLDRVMRFSYQLSVLYMGISVSTKTKKIGPFFFAYAATRFISILTYFKIFLIPRAKFFAMYFTIWNTMLLIVSIVMGVWSLDTKHFKPKKGSSWSPYDYSPLLAFCIVVVVLRQIVVTMSFRITLVRLPINVPHVAERMGLFVMLVMGESLISMIATRIPLSWRYYGVIIQAFTLIYFLQQLYFDSQPPEERIKKEFRSHALRSTQLSAITFLVVHYFILIALLAIGVSYKLGLKHLSKLDEYHPFDFLLGGYGIFLMIVCVNILRMTHPFKNRHRKLWSIRIFLITLLALNPLAPLRNFFVKGRHLYQPFIFSVLSVILVFALAALDTEAREVYDFNKEAEKERAEEAKHKLQKTAEEAESQHMKMEDAWQRQKSEAETVTSADIMASREMSPSSVTSTEEDDRIDEQIKDAIEKGRAVEVEGNKLDLVSRIKRVASAHENLVA